MKYGLFPELDAERLVEQNYDALSDIMHEAYESGEITRLNQSISNKATLHDALDQMVKVFSDHDTAVDEHQERAFRAVRGSMLFTMVLGSIIFKQKSALIRTYELINKFDSDMELVTAIDGFLDNRPTLTEFTHSHLRYARERAPIGTLAVRTSGFLMMGMQIRAEQEYIDQQFAAFTTTIEPGSE